MKISFNPLNSNKNILDLIKSNKDIIFDLKGHNIFARGVEFKGTDTNTWRPVVDNLTSNSTTSSLSANQGRVLKALIDGKSDSKHNHDGRYVRYYTVTTLDCNNLASGLTVARVNATNAASAHHSAYLYISDVGTPFQIQIPDSDTSFIYKRYYSSGKWSEWFKLNAGYADSAGSVAWANVTNKPATATRWPSWAEVTGKPSSFTPADHNHDNKYLRWLGNAGQSNMNAIGRISHSSGMTALSDPGNTIDNPMEGSAKSTSWHLYWQTNYTDTPSGSNAWVAQIVNRAGTDRWWVRSRNGGTITNGTGWTSNWRFLVTAPTSGLGNGNQPIYINSAGEVVAANSYPTSLKSPHSLTLKANGTTLAVYDGSSVKEANFTYANVGAASASHNHDERYVKSFGASNDNIDSDWGQSFKTFDPIPSGTPPEKNPNISLLSIGNSFNRRKQLAFTYSNDNIYYRRRADNGFTNWRRIAFANEIPSSLKNPHALTISLNGTSQGPYDGSAVKNINITPGSIGAATSGHTHSWQSITDKIVGGNEFNIVNAGYNNTLAINYLPIDNRNGSATITQYNIYNGNKGLASVYAYRFKADGKSCMWKYARNYAPFCATFNGGFEPILDIKTKSGDWSLGSFSDWGNHLIFAFTSDSDFNAGVNGTAQYYLTAQGEFKINTLRLAGAVSGNMGVNSTNPQIIFAEGSATQQVAITYTDWDTYRPSKGLKVHSYDGSDDANVWFEVQGYNYSSGYVKNGSSNSYVLLGGGGHKPLSEFSLNSSDYDNRYLKLTGGTMTGVIRFNNLISSNSALVLDYKYSAGGFARDIVSMKNSVYGDADLGALSILCYPNSTSNGFQYIYLGTDKYNGPNNLRIYKDKVTFGNNILIDAGNIGSQTVDKSYHLRVNHSVSANSTWSTWYWMGQSGQPTWLWGCNDGGNMYVWNPSNFSVKYATSAGSVSNSLNIFGVSYNGSAAKTVTTSTFVSQLPEGTSTVTDGTMFITSWASDSGFADTNAVNVPYKRKASCLWSYIDSKVSSKYLPLAGGTMNGNARIGHGSGNLYIGNSGNDGWIYTQDIASQSGTDKWWVRESGAAHFGNVYICAKSDYITYDSSIIECYTGNNLYLNYYSTKGVNLCNGGGTVQIGPYTTGDTGNNKLFVNGSEFIQGASNVRDHVFANGFRHRSHNSNDSVLLAGGGYSQGVPVKYWSIETIIIYGPTQVSRTNRGGNYTFVTKVEPRINGSCTLTLQFPSGYNNYNTIIWAMGRLNQEAHDSSNSSIYATIVHLEGSKYYLNLADDESLNNGTCQLYFMCF